MKPTIPTPNPPEMDWQLIPDLKSIDLSDIPEICHLAIHSIASAAQIAKQWVGVGTWHICFAIRGAAGPELKHDPADSFIEASRTGWITIAGPYAHPTQQLADRITRRS